MIMIIARDDSLGTSHGISVLPMSPAFRPDFWGGSLKVAEEAVELAWNESRNRCAGRTDKNAGVREEERDNSREKGRIIY
jgi:hypothetical protein